MARVEVMSRQTARELAEGLIEFRSTTPLAARVLAVRVERLLRLLNQSEIEEGSEEKPRENLVSTREVYRILNGDEEATK